MGRRISDRCREDMRAAWCRFHDEKLVVRYCGVSLPTVKKYRKLDRWDLEDDPAGTSDKNDDSELIRRIKAELATALDSTKLQGLPLFLHDPEKPKKLLDSLDTLIRLELRLKEAELAGRDHQRIPPVVRLVFESFGDKHETGDTD